MNDLFVRVRPVVGEALDLCQVAIVGSPAAGALVEYLAGCGVRHWLALAGNEWMGAQVAKLRERYGGELDITLEVVGSVAELGAADLVLVVDHAEVDHAEVDYAEVAWCLPLTLPRLMIFTCTQHHECRALLALAGEKLECAGASLASDMNEWVWATAAPLMALAARALLLRGTRYAMASWEDAWANGQRAYCVGGALDPTLARWQARFGKEEAERSIYCTPTLRRGTLLIVGLGSLGSVAAWQLAPWVERLVLVDPDCVEMANLVRQAYVYPQLGARKATALAQTLSAAHPRLVCEIVADSLTREDQVTALVRAYGVSAALVTTGTLLTRLP